MKFKNFDINIMIQTQHYIFIPVCKGTNDMGNEL
jgi:hypothetical protein